MSSSPEECFFTDTDRVARFQTTEEGSQGSRFLQVSAYLYGDLTTISPTIISTINLNFKKEIELNPSGKILFEKTKIIKGCSEIVVGEIVAESPCDPRRFPGSGSSSGCRPPPTPSSVATAATARPRAATDAPRREWYAWTTDGIGTPDPNPKHFVNWCFYYEFVNDHYICLNWLSGSLVEGSGVPISLVT